MFTLHIPSLQNRLWLCFHHMAWRVVWTGQITKKTQYIFFFNFFILVQQKEAYRESFYTEHLNISKSLRHDIQECSVLLSAAGSGPPAWLRSRHPALGAQRRPGQPLQLGRGSLLHRLQPARLGLLQSHRHSLWQQVKKRYEVAPFIWSPRRGVLPLPFFLNILF